VNQESFITCFECEYTYASAEELVEKHLAVLRDLGIEPMASDLVGAKIDVCPECSHDFY
jgi:hypothetical protein